MVLGRPRTRIEGTVLVRMDRKLKKELSLSFPESKMPEIINIMYRTSGLRLENVLRRDLIVKKKK